MNPQGYHPSAPPLAHPSSSSSSITTTTATHLNGTPHLHNASSRPSTSHHSSWQPSISREEGARGGTGRGGTGGSRERHPLERQLSAPTTGPSDNTGAGSRSLREASNGVGTRGVVVRSVLPASSSSRNQNQYSAPPPSSPSSGLRSPRSSTSSSQPSFQSANGHQWDSRSERNHERGGSGQGYTAPSSGSATGWLGPHSIRQPSLPDDNKKDEAVEAAIRASRDEAQVCISELSSRVGYMFPHTEFCSTMSFH